MACVSQMRRVWPKAVSTRSLRPLAQEATRSMRTASAASLTPEDEAPLDIHIFDIFDAPSRLGESSKLLSRASTARAATAAASTSRSANVRSERPRGAHTIEPLPAPVMFDGPATHKHLSFCAYGTQYEHSHNMTSSSPSTERRILSTLPPPVIFDGPSQLRPYARNREEQHKVRQLFHPMFTDI